MIDLVKAKSYFKEYVSHYDTSIRRVNIKIVHTYHVAENARKIAEGLNLSKEEQDLAELIGLLHDIGRFEQLRIYDTFADEISVDHAEKGIEVLFRDNEIRNLVKTDEYDEIIRKAIYNHNKFTIEEGLSEKELLQAKIIRDADKLDIFRVPLKEDLKDFVHMETEDVSKEILSPEFFEEFKKEKLFVTSTCKTNMDFMVAIFAFIYDFNFEKSLQIIQENDYIHRIVEKINAQDVYTKQKLDEIADYAIDYINRKLNLRGGK